MRDQPDFATHPRPRRPPAREIGLLLVGLLALGLVGRSAWEARRTMAQAREQVAGARRELESLEARSRSVSGASEAEAALVARAGAATETPPERVVATLAQVLPADVRLDRLRIDYGDTISLEMHVVAREPASWDLFLARLGGDPRFENVIPGPERRSGEVRTVVSARWAGGGAR